eukprot:393602-Rhodomonas_salina.6
MPPPARDITGASTLQPSPRSGPGPRHFSPRNHFNRLSHRRRKAWVGVGMAQRSGRWERKRADRAGPG